MRSRVAFGLVQGRQGPEHVGGLVRRQLGGVDVRQPVDKRPRQRAALVHGDVAALLVELPAEAQLVERRDHLAST